MSDDIFPTVLDLCGVKEQDLPSETIQAALMRIGYMYSAAHVWQKPAEIEDQLEDARTKLAAAISAIESLDGFAKTLARNEALKPRDQEFERRIVQIAESDWPKEKKESEMNKAFKAFPPIPTSEWVDIAAIAKMKELRAALVRPIEDAIPHTQTGRGRPPNLRAYYVTEHAYVLYQELTGEKPTFWNGGGTPFSRLLEYLFHALGIKSTIRKPIEAAMHKFEGK